MLIVIIQAVLNYLLIACGIQALDWLKSSYWEPQTMVISSDPSYNVRKEIRFVLGEFFLSFDYVMQNPQPYFFTEKEKRTYTLLIIHLVYFLF